MFMAGNCSTATISEVASCIAPVQLPGVADHSYPTASEHLAEGDRPVWVDSDENDHRAIWSAHRL
jgi:hypothetical protein